MGLVLQPGSAIGSVGGAGRGVGDFRQQDDGSDGGPGNFRRNERDGGDDVDGLRDCGGRGDSG